MKSKMSLKRAFAWCCGALAATLLASCGGGDLVSTFSAQRVIAFGDETSVIDDNLADANGRKYSVNGIVSTSDSTRDCQNNPLWIQKVAGSFGLVFPQCNPAPSLVSTAATPAAAPASRIRAAAGATVADLDAQIAAQLAQSAFTSRDLVTVLVGQNDVLAQYAQYPGVSEAVLGNNLEAAGVVLGRQVNRLADSGAKVLISTIIDLGQTPYGSAEKAAHADTDRSALLSRLIVRFNDGMRETLVNDGRKIGLVLTNELISSIVNNAGSYSFTDQKVAVCATASVLDCSENTLISGGSSSTYLWADDRHLSAGGQNAFGDLAVARAKGNPF